jgi:hypothetical protein
MKEVQKLSFNTEDVRETHKLTINTPDDGYFRIVFTNPSDLKKSFSNELKSTMNPDEFRDAVNPYFNSVGVNAIVTKKTLNTDDTETDVAEEIVKTVFEFKLDRLVEAPSVSVM